MLSFDATFLVVLASFVLFMLLMKQLYFDPVARIKAARDAQLREDKMAAQTLKQNQEALFAQYEQALKDARIQAQQQIQATTQQAQQTATEALREARQKTQADLAQHVAELAAWQNQAFEQLAGEREALVELLIEKVTSAPTGLSVKKPRKAATKASASKAKEVSEEEEEAALSAGGSRS